MPLRAATAALGARREGATVRTIPEDAMNDDERRLVPLGETRAYAVREGMPDVRGWEVVGGDGTVLGRVSELMVDPAVGRVRYLEVETGDAERRRVHVPIGLARLDAERDAVLVPTITMVTMRSLTTVQGRTLTREYEVHVRRSLAGEAPADAADASAPDADEGFYEHEHYDEREFAGPRRGRRRSDREGDDDEDFGYLAGVGGAMTDRDAHPEVVGEMGAGQISVPLMEEETRRRVAPEDGTAPAQEGPPPDARR